MACTTIPHSLRQLAENSKANAARADALSHEKATLEEMTRTLAGRQAAVDRRAPFVKAAAPFFDWLAASDDDDDGDDDEDGPTAAGEQPKASKATSTASAVDVS